MSLWQFAAAMDGYNRANNPESDKALTGSEEDALWNWIQV